MEFEKLEEEKEFEFYGVDGNFFKIGEYVFEVVEDPADDYRSWMDEVGDSLSDEKLKEENLIFFKNPIAKIRIEAEDSLSYDGYNLVDIENNHVWLQFGTDNSCAYYPCFSFHYDPITPIEK